jgi:hypothetical protein
VETCEIHLTALRWVSCDTVATLVRCIIAEPIVWPFWFGIHFSAACCIVVSSDSECESWDVTPEVY